MNKITFISDGLKIAGNLEIVKDSSKGVLILHGAGSSSKKRFAILQPILSQNGWSSLAIDFRGVGESEGKFEDGSLTNRLTDAINAYDELAKYADTLVVIGASMGGHIAARLTEKRPVDALILLYAAAYGSQTQNLPLNREFTKSINKPNSFANSPAFSAMGKFTHPILVVYGDKDKVIPNGVQEKYKQKSTEGRFVIIKNGQHGFFHSQSQEGKRIREQVINEIVAFLREYL